jgi:hypothetical protein
VELRDGKTIVELAREQTESALQTLVEVKDDPNAPAGARVSASIALLDRGWGRPNTPVTGDPANPIAFADVTEDAERVKQLIAALGRRQLGLAQ